MKQIKIIFILINFSWAIGLKSLLIPVDAVSMASSNTGIAQSESVKINPAIIVSQKSNSLSVSLNNWLGGVKGSALTHHWENQYVYMNSYQVDDIELYELIQDQAHKFILDYDNQIIDYNLINNNILIITLCNSIAKAFN